MFQRRLLCFLQVFNQGTGGPDGCGAKFFQSETVQDRHAELFLQQVGRGIDAKAPLRTLRNHCAVIEQCFQRTGLPLRHENFAGVQTSQQICQARRFDSRHKETPGRRIGPGNPDARVARLFGLADITRSERRQRDNCFGPDPASPGRSPFREKPLG